MALHSAPQLFVDDRCMFSREGNALVDDFASVDAVLQDQIERAARKPLAAIGAPIRRHAAFADHACGGEIIPQGAHGPEFNIASKDASHGLRFRFIDNEFPFLDVVAERGLTPHPHALLFRRGDLVSDSFSRYLALELSEGEQHV